MSWIDSKFEDAPFDIIDGDRGKNYPNQSELHENGFCVFLSATNVTQNGLKFDECQFITEDKDSALRKGKLKREDIVLTTRGTLGQVGYFSKNVPFENLRINSGMVILRVDQTKLRPFFLYSYLRSSVFKFQVNLFKSGAAQPQLPIRDLKKIKLSFPGLEEQNRISSFIGAYDDLIENNNRRIALLEESARLLYQEWFVHLRFPGHEHCKIIDGVPEGWAIQKTDSVAQTIGGGTPSTKKPEYWDEGDVVWFSPTDITKSSSIAILDSAKKITSLGLQKSSAKELPPRTILMTSRASIGYFGIFEGVATTNQGFISLVPNQENYRWYLLHNLSSRVDEIKGLAGGATFKEINKTTFRNIDVVIPANNLLDLFDEHYSKVYEQILSLSRQNQKLIEARDILLPRLMSGEIVV